MWYCISLNMLTYERHKMCANIFKWKGYCFSECTIVVFHLPSDRWLWKRGSSLIKQFVWTWGFKVLQLQMSKFPSKLWTLDKEYEIVWANEDRLLIDTNVSKCCKLNWSSDLPEQQVKLFVVQYCPCVIITQSCRTKMSLLFSAAEKKRLLAIFGLPSEATFFSLRCIILILVVFFFIIWLFTMGV